MIKASENILSFYRQNYNKSIHQTFSRRNIVTGKLNCLKIFVRQHYVWIESIKYVLIMSRYFSSFVLLVSSSFTVYISQFVLECISLVRKQNITFLLILYPVGIPFCKCGSILISFETTKNIELHYTIWHRIHQLIHFVPYNNFYVAFLRKLNKKKSKE